VQNDGLATSRRSGFAPCLFQGLDARLTGVAGRVIRERIG